MLLNFAIFSGVVVLAILSAMDLKSMEIDSRLNWFMFGVVTMVLIQSVTTAGFALLLGGIMYIASYKSRGIGDGDPEVLAWVTALLFCLNPVSAIVFMILIAAGAIVIALLKKRVPFVPAITYCYAVSIAVSVITRYRLQ